MRAWAFAGIAATAVSLQPLRAAPAVTLKVGPDQRLVISPAAVRQLGLRQKRGELVCIEFPRPAEPRKVPAGHSDRDGHDHSTRGKRAPRVYLGLGNTGGLAVPRMRQLTAGGFIPGRPGTVYRGVVRDGILVLTAARL